MRAARFGKLGHLLLLGKPQGGVTPTGGVQLKRRAAPNEKRLAQDNSTSRIFILFCLPEPFPNGRFSRFAERFRQKLRFPAPVSFR